MGREILNILCPHCGAPAKFDIVHQIYRCGYCGGQVEVENARRQKAEFQWYQNQRVKAAAMNFPMSTASCSGCGATLVFEKNEALSTCAFCGRSVVRRDYVYDSKMPQNIIPFAVTPKEAAGLLSDWCQKNRNKPEARHLSEKIGQLKGYYLPYEMVHGRVRCDVRKKGETASYVAGGYLNDEFVNCSAQLDNLVLDCMEPYNLDNLREFDFAYAAGQRIKISDISEADVQQRLNTETAENYRGGMEKIWGTKDIDILAQVDPVVRIPVLLPVYYITDGNVHAAVNGQTGKVSVRAEKESKYIAVPWWLKGILVLLAASAALYSAILFGGGGSENALIVTGMTAFLYIIILLAMFDSQSSNRFHVIKYRSIFSSGEQTYRRERGKLILREDIVKRKIEAPVFKHNLDGRVEVVTYVFRSFARSLRMLMLGVVTIFFPVILALLINGFDFSRLTISASAVWFCITVPVVPIIFIKYGIQSLYESPLIYIISENGKKRRYRKKSGIKGTDVLNFTKEALFSVPICFLTWFAIFVFVMTIYFTAFGME